MLLVALALLAVAQADPRSADKAREIIEARLGDAVNDDALDRAAVAGMADLVDQTLGTEGNSVLTEAEHKAALAWTRGERAGIGVEYRVIAGRGLVITAVFDGGPGALAGLETDDLVIGINGEPFTGQAAHAIHQSLQTAEGASLALDVRRRKGIVQRVDVPRGRYQVPTVLGAEDAMRPVVRVTFLGEGTATQLSRELSLLDPSLGVVLDLRDNEGGLLSEAIAMSDLFLDTGAVVVQERSAGTEDVAHSAAGEPTFQGPVVVLVNRGTKGAAEAFAAAVQTNRVATIVGTTTAGQASMPSYHPLGNGLILRLMDIRLAGPDGRSWQGEGVRPDLVVEAPALSLPPMDRPGADTDLQREAALGLLRTASSP